MLKTYSQYVCAAACLLFIQVCVILPWGNHGIRPDLLVFVVVWAAVTLPVIHCACIIFIISFFFESLTGAPSGLFISTYLLIFAVIALLKRFFNFNTLVELFGLLLASLAVKFLLLCFFIAFVYEYHHVQTLLTFFRETLFTLFLFPVLFPLIQKYIGTKQAPGTSADGIQTHGS